MKHLKKFENVAALAMPPESKVHKTLRKAKDKFTDFFDSDMDRENDRLHQSEMQLNVAKDLLHKVKTKYLHSDNIDNAIIIAEDALDTINNMGNFSGKDKYVNELKDIIQQLKDENNVRKYASPSKEEAEDVSKNEPEAKEPEFSKEQEEENMRKYANPGGNSYKVVDTEETRRKRLDDYEKFKPTPKRKHKPIKLSDTKTTKKRSVEKKKIEADKKEKSPVSTTKKTKIPLSKRLVKTPETNKKQTKRDRKKYRKQRVKDFYDFMEREKQKEKEKQNKKTRK